MRRLPSWPVLCLLCAASALIVVILGTRLTFFNDDWYFLLLRPGLSADSVFAPHNGHLSALPVLIYKGLVELFGLDDQLPFRLVLAVTIAGLGVLVYLLVRERVGSLLGLLAAAVVLFLGPAWEDLLWTFQIGLIGSLATGLAALLALERDRPRRNVVACVLLVCSISLSDLGVPFVVAAAIAILLRRRPERLWIPAVPLVLFGAWWIAYGSDAPSNVSMANIRGLPEYVLDSVANGLVSITGLTQVADGVWRRRLVLLAVAIGIAVWLIRGGRPSREVLIFLGAALTFWVLAGAGYVPGRAPLASRYQLVDATFLILIAAELARPASIRFGASVAAVVIALLVLVANLETLQDGYKFMRLHSAYAKADLGALEITRGRSAPEYQLFETVAHDPYLSGVIAGRYFSATDAHGSPPTDSPGQIAGAPPKLRRAADHVIVGGYAMQLVRARRSGSAGPCRRLHGARLAEAKLPVGATWVTNLGEGPVAIGVRRFAPPHLPVELGFLEGGLSARIGVPRDSVKRPWHLVAGGRSALRMCRL